MISRRAGFAMCAFLSLFFFAVINSTHGALLTEFIDYYALEEASQGMAVSAQNIGCLAALISSLFVMGRVKKPTLIWLASAGTVIVTIPLGLPPSFAIFILIFLLIGFLVGYTDTLASSSIADLYTGRRATAMMCALHAVFGAAGVICPLVMKRLLTTGANWYSIFTMITILGCVLLIYIVPMSIKWSRQKPERAPDQPHDGRLSLGEVKSYLSRPDRLLLIGAVFFYGAYLSGITVWIDRYIDVGLKSGELGAISLSVFWLGITASRLLTPLIKFRPERIVAVSSIISAALLFIGIASGSAAAMCALSVAGALISGAAIPLLINSACSRYARSTLLATTFVLMAIYISQSICPPLMGYIATARGLTAAMYVCPAAILACGVLAGCVRRTPEVRSES